MSKLEALLAGKAAAAAAAASDGGGGGASSEAVVREDSTWMRKRLLEQCASAPLTREEILASSAQALQASLSRGLDGTLGIDVDLFEGHPTVANLVPGGPAERQGTLQPGDIILRINGTACATIAQVLNALAAPIDPVHIEALRRQRRVLVSQDLLVRVNLESRVAATSARNGGLARLPTTWSACRCELL